VKRNTNFKEYGMAVKNYRNSITKIEKKNDLERRKGVIADH
jgi:hypothetical protein